MKQISVRKYDPIDAIQILGDMDEYPDWVYNRMKYGPAYTAVAPGGRVIACAGLFIYSALNGEVWLTPGDAWDEYAREMVIYTGSLLAQWESEYGLLRIQAVVNVCEPSHVRFIEHYGFVREGLMRAFGPVGEDMYMYAKVRR